MCLLQNKRRNARNATTEDRKEERKIKEKKETRKKKERKNASEYQVRRSFLFSNPSPNLDSRVSSLDTLFQDSARL